MLLVPPIVIVGFFIYKFWKEMYIDINFKNNSFEITQHLCGMSDQALEFWTVINCDCCKVCHFSNVCVCMKDSPQCV